MRRVVVWFVCVALVALFVGQSSGLDIQKGGVVQASNGSSPAQFLYSASTITSLPSGFTVYSKDASAFYITRQPNGVSESVSIYVPAGKSILIPAPEASVAASIFNVSIIASAQTDSVFCLPWYGN